MNDFEGILEKGYDQIRQADETGDIWVEVSRLITGPGTVLEIGTGKGDLTKELLSTNPEVRVIALDVSKSMLDEACNRLSGYKDRIEFVCDDALGYLQRCRDQVEYVVSSLTLHNFEQTYREKTLQAIFDVLKQGGSFINGDKFAIPGEHATLYQQQNQMFERKLAGELLQAWLAHLRLDNDPQRLMWLDKYHESLGRLGFGSAQETYRTGGMYLVINARKEA